jgi:hypothetical protein
VPAGDLGAGGEQEQDYEESPLLGGEAGDHSSSYGPDVAGMEEFSIMDKFFLASYLFFQGLLAGFSTALVYIVEQSGSDNDLLINYQPSSNEIRRILFIFGGISFVGALESFGDTWRRKRYAPSGGGGGRGRQWHWQGERGQGALEEEVCGLGRLHHYPRAARKVTD